MAGPEQGERLAAIEASLHGELGLIARVKQLDELVGGVYRLMGFLVGGATMVGYILGLITQFILSR
jgi:hypothetical protein